MKIRNGLIVVALFFCMVMNAQNKMILNADQGELKINKHIYGHFAEHLGHCIYGGIWVGEDSSIPNTRGIRNDVAKALKDMKIPNLRWPGGCFADEYHWMDGIGPRSQRPTMINTNWGGVTEDNSFGTHEFLDLCEQLGTEPYICGNVGSGSVEEMSKWVEYITFDGKSPMADLRKQNGRDKPWKVQFWGVGNENWGCGGNMTAEYYADVMNRYSTFVKNYGSNRLYRIAGGPNAADYHWTEVLMQKSARRMQGMSLHFYTRPVAGGSRSATQFDENDYYGLLANTYRMDELVSRHSTIMDQYDPSKRIGLCVDEWGTWFAVEPGTNPGFLYQQNTMRDAIVAGINLNIFNKHCDRVQMAQIAQTVNVLQAVILTEQGGQNRMLLTPTYWVFHMYQVHQDATMLPIHFTCNKRDIAPVSGTQAAPGMGGGAARTTIDLVSASASKDASGRVHITLVNCDLNNTQTVECDLGKFAAKSVSGKVLTSAKITDHNTFDTPNTVTVKDFTGAKINGGALSIPLPSKSVVVLELM